MNLRNFLRNLKKTQNKEIMHQWVQGCKILADASEIMEKILADNNYINVLAEHGEMIKF